MLSLVNRCRIRVNCARSDAGVLGFTHHMWEKGKGAELPMLFHHQTGVTMKSDESSQGWFGGLLSDLSNLTNDSPPVMPGQQHLAVTAAGRGLDHEFVGAACSDPVQLPGLGPEQGPHVLIVSMLDTSHPTSQRWQTDRPIETTEP